MSNKIEIGKVYQATFKRLLTSTSNRPRFHVEVQEITSDGIRGDYCFLSDCFPGRGRKTNIHSYTFQGVGLFYKEDYTFKLLKQKKLKCRK